VAAPPNSRGAIRTAAIVSAASSAGPALSASDGPPERIPSASRLPAMMAVKKFTELVST